MRWFVHNVIAHPLLVLCPPLGWRLHDLTAPPDVAEPNEAQAHNALKNGTD